MRTCTILAILVTAATLSFPGDALDMSTGLATRLSVERTETTLYKRRQRRTGMSRTNSDTQERAIDSAMVAQIRAKMEAINMQLNYRDWFWGGKTLEEVRALLHLPATGEAVGHVNWTAYLNYLKYIKEREVEAANAAMVEAIKWKLTYKGWFLDGKSFKQVRAILGIAEKGDDVDNVNWEIFQNYLKFVKEYAKQFT